MTVAFTVAVQLFASVIVKVYKPAVNPVCVGLMENGDVPPVVVIIILPLDPPLHEGEVTDDTVPLTAGGPEMEVLAVAAADELSVTVTE